jgi:hypothetical protein
MSGKTGYEPKRVAFQVSTKQRPNFDHPLAAYVFDPRGELLERQEVREGTVELTLPQGDLGKVRILIAPVATETQKPTADQLLRLGAYEPVLHAGG